MCRKRKIASLVYKKIRQSTRAVKETRLCFLIERFHKIPDLRRDRSLWLLDSKPSRFPIRRLSSTRIGGEEGDVICSRRGVEISKSSVVVDRVRDLYPRQGGRDGERRQTKRPSDSDRWLKDGRRDLYQRGEAREGDVGQKRRKCSPVSGERKDQVFPPPLGEKTIVDVVHVVRNSRWNRSSLTPESGEFQVDSSDERRSNSSESRSLEPLSSHENSEHEINMDVGEEECCASDLNDSEVDEAEGGLSMLSGSRDVNEYQKLSKINEGTYGVVYKAKDRKTEEIVALKMIKMNMEDEYGFPLTSLREINILLSCNHPSIVNVKEVVVGNGDSVFMVMEHLEHDLRGVMDRMKQPFSTSEVKCLMIQLLEGLKYLHSNWIIHRDLKPSNLLLNNSGELKICDFGMARQYGSPIKPYTQLVVTQWYRSPELLLGTKEYSTAVDMWSIGCIMGELLSLKPLFRGKSQNDIDQLQQIFAVLGTPSETTWPGFTSLPELGFDLLNRLLNVDPEKRLTVDEALNHAWFNEVPLQKSKEFMPTFPSKRN
ncbi:hypothetical protein HID58_022734 [Brassica napus]|uniref:cyclin-dependent kinase n=1 Tax=Brassica napus TaxID=3708 RepID=A0ABQ8D2P6_BRANA|nr:hypothetical protein HID58_022734 [Brassica napus]